MYDQDQQRRLFNLSKDLLKTDTGAKVTVGEAKEEVNQLRETIVYHEWKYYVKNDPVISDFEYDHLYKRLEALEEQYPDLITPDSPTQRVSADLTSDFPTVKHLSPMLSLANSYNEDDLNDFDTSIRKLTSLDENAVIEYAVEPKFDGGTIVLVYENDLLVRGATRGNGDEGEEITNNAKVIRSIPLKAEFSKYGLSRVELRGEVVIRKDVFKKMNDQKAAAGETLYANPRNTATGGLRIKDPKEVAQRGLEAFVFQMSYAEDADGNNGTRQFEKHSEIIDMLGNLGFKIPQSARTVVSDVKGVLKFCNNRETNREAYPYEIDGMVVKVNSLVLQEICGATSHHPRWAIAFKFKAKQATTKLLDVEYQVGKIGSITPVAKLEPVQLAGVTVSSVSLHNEDFITSKDIRLGDTVLVERAGDVIPYIVKPMDELRDGSEIIIDFPKTCPINPDSRPYGVELIRTEGEAAWRCPDCVCGAQDLMRMIFHISKDAMNIDGFGGAYIIRFHEMGWLRNMADIYNLDYDQIAELEGFGQKSAANLKKSIDKAKSNPIRRLLHSLSIHHLGKRASVLISERIEHVLDLKEWTIEDYTNIKDIGPVVAENMIEWFANERNVEMLRQMEAYGVNMHQTQEDKPVEVAADAPLVGKTILFTGALQHFSRKEAQKLATLAGAKNISAVSSNLDILVVGEKAGSKLRKAEALGTVQIMTEDEFLALVS
ncbi:MAG: NAD-dependent DNA ligase LigA [Bacteroidota bacterium]